MPEKKRNYDALTIELSHLKLQDSQDLGRGDVVRRRSGKGSSGKDGSRKISLTHELIMRIIERMKDI